MGRGKSKKKRCFKVSGQKKYHLPFFNVPPKLYERVMIICRLSLLVVVDITIRKKKKEAIDMRFMIRYFSLRSGLDKFK